MLGRLLSAFSPDQRKAPDSRARLAAQEWPAVIYAIGDIHGALPNLLDLEELIAQDAAGVAGEKWIVTLGDYIDRGPNSSSVLERLSRPKDDQFRWITLCGNHEQMFLDFLDDPISGAMWSEFGGQETAASYGLRVDFRGLDRRGLQHAAAQLRSIVPEEHLQFLRDLPVSLSVPGYHFTHAPLRDGVSFEGHSDHDLMWTREADAVRVSQDGTVVVHGHIPAREPVFSEARICLDTGAFATGILTAARLDRTGAVKLLSSRL